MSEATLEIRHITDFQPDPRNANKGTQRGLSLLEDSIAEDGAGRSMLATADGVLIAGNKTQAALIERGIEEVIVIHTDGTRSVIVQRDDVLAGTPHAQRMGVRDNRTSEVGLDWDVDVLDSLDIDLGGLFFDSELAELGIGPDEQPEDPGPQIDKAAELQEKWQVARGQIWTVGPHRIMCGDSTSAEDVARLMGGEKVNLLFTSPPYADVRSYGGDDLSTQSLAKFIERFVNVEYQVINLGIVRRDNELVEYWNDYISEARRCGYKFLSWNVWDKMLAGSISNQSAMFAIEHEWIFVFGRKPKPLNRTVEKSPDSHKRLAYNRRDKKGRMVRAVRQADGTMRDSVKGQEYSAKNLPTVVQLVPEMARLVTDRHPAIMPVSLPTVYIEAMATLDDVVADPFLGSGTTMVAAEQTGRICYGMEIEPKYCAVTLERMAGMGLEPRLVES